MLHRFFVVLLSFLTYTICEAQTNLVRNPGFEDKNTCTLATYEGIDTVWYDDPTAYTKVVYWMSPNYVTPDYYNRCQTDTLFRRYSIPENQAGYQWPNNGQAYTGFIAYSINKEFSPTGKVREYIQSQLASAMEPDALYCATFYCSIGYYDAFNIISTDDLAMAITHQPPRNKNTAPYLDPNTDASIQLTPQIIKKGQFHIDTAAWYPVKGLFRATGGEQWITIGVFVDQGEADTLILRKALKPTLEGYTEAYYYIDDVSIIKVSGPIIAEREKVVCRFPDTLHAAPGFAGYLWSTGEVTPSIVIDRAGDYWVQATIDECGSTVDTVVVKLYVPPAFSTLADVEVCSTALPYVVEAPNNFVQYTWSTGETTRQISVDQPGSYSVELFDGCTTRADTFDFSVIAPVPAFDLGDTVYLCRDGLLVPAELSPDVELPNYLWSTGEVTPTITASFPGLYGLRTSNACGSLADEVWAVGCTNRLYVPNVFTPDDPGQNDRFRPYANTPGHMTLQVFDRWGGLLFHESGADLEGWDGYAGGKPASPGVYTWMLRYQEDISAEERWYSGTITLIR